MVAGLSLGTGRDWWWGSECTVLSFIITRLRWDPWARHRTPKHLDGLNAEHKFWVWEPYLATCHFTSHICWLFFLLLFFYYFYFILFLGFFISFYLCYTLHPLYLYILLYFYFILYVVILFIYIILVFFISFYLCYALHPTCANLENCTVMSNIKSDFIL